MIASMKTFRVYPKDPKESEPFSLSFQRFELKGDRFILYNSRDEESAEGFLSIANIAAIIPEKQMAQNRSYPNTPITFSVYLKDRAAPIDVLAHAFTTDEQSVTFLEQRKSMVGIVQDEWPINEVYVATSELIAVLPSDGLLWRG
jgi:hypothetical protein